MATNKVIQTKERLEQSTIRYRNSDCPSGHSSSYCLGWDGGYATGFNAQETIDESVRQSSNSDNEDDDDYSKH